MPATLGTLGIWVVANMGPLSSGLQQASAQVHRFSTATRGVFQKLDIAVGGLSKTLEKNTAQFALWGAAGAIVFMRLVRGSLDFQRELIKIGTFLKDDVAGGLGTVQEQLARYKDAIKKISLDTGVALDQLAEGLSRLIQFGYKEAEALEVLRASAEFAVVAFSDMEKTTTAVVKIMDAFSIPVDRTREFFGKLFAAIDVSEAVAEDFASEFVQVATQAKLVGAAIEPLLAAYGILTFRFKNANTAGTALARLLTGIIKISDKAVKVGEKYGINIKASSIETMGFVNWLKQFEKVAPRALGKLTERIPALTALTVLLKENARFLKFLDNVVAGTAETFTQKFLFVLESSPNKLERVGAALVILRQKMVDTLLKGLDPLIVGFGKFLRLMTKLPDSISAVALSIVGLGTVLALLAAASGFLIKISGIVIGIYGALLAPTILSATFLLAKRIGTLGASFQAMGSSMGRTVPILARVENQLRSFVLAPQLATKATKIFADLSNKQAQTMGALAARLRVHTISMGEASAVAASKLGITAAEAQKKLNLLVSGAVRDPSRALIFRFWDRLGQAVRSFGRWLTIPIRTLYDLGKTFTLTTPILREFAVTLGLIGEGLIFIGRAVPGLVPALTFVARFFTGWVAFFIAAFDIAIPGSISRFITILVEEFKIGFALVKALFRGLGIVFTETMNLLKKAWKGFIDIIPKGIRDWVADMRFKVIFILDETIQKLKEYKEVVDNLFRRPPTEEEFQKGVTEAIRKRALTAAQLKALLQEYKLDTAEEVEKVVKALTETTLAEGIEAKKIIKAPALEGKPETEVRKILIPGIPGKPGTVLLNLAEIGVALNDLIILADTLAKEDIEATKERSEEVEKLLKKYEEEGMTRVELTRKEFDEILKLTIGNTKLRERVLKAFSAAITKAEIEDEKKRQDIMDDEEAQRRLQLYERLAEIEIVARTEQEKLLMGAKAWEDYEKDITDINKKLFQKAIEPLLEYIELQEEAAGLAGDFAQEQFFAQQRISLEAKKAEKETGSAIAGTIAKQKGTIELEDKRLDRVMKRADEELKTGKKIARSMDEEDEARRQFIEQAQMALKQYSQELEKMGMRPEAIEEMDQFQTVLRAIVEEMEILDDRSTSVLDAIMRGFEDAKGKAIGYLERIREATREVIENIRTTLSDFLFDWITGELESITDVFKNFLRGIIRAITDFITGEIVRKFLELLQDIFGWEQPAARIPKIVSDELRVKKIIVGGEEEEGKKAPEIGKTFSNIMQTLPEIFGGKKGKAKGTPPTFPGGTSLKDFMGMQNILGNILGDFSGKLKDIFGNMSGGFKDILGNILGGLKGGLGDILSSLGGGGLGGILGGLKGGMGGILGTITSFLPFLPFQEGGIVKSPVLGMLGEKGPEAVIPLDRMGSAPISLQFNINTLDGANFAEYLRRNADILSTTIVSDILRNKNIRKTLIRMG